MSVRYVEMAKRPRVRSWISDTEISWQDRPSTYVWVADGEPIDTGLVTASGMILYRIQERTPIGFVVGGR